MSLPVSQRWPAVGLALGLHVAAVRADLPLAEHGPKAVLANSSQVTFEPLGVAAVLHNPRAGMSAARLYTQYDRRVFIWPHTMMIGATLIPVKILVEHLTATFKSIHPAITLCTQDTQNLPVVSNMVFKEFPLDFGNMWLADVIAYKSSSKPANDFMIVCMDDNGATSSSTSTSTSTSSKNGDEKHRFHGPSHMTRWLGCSALNLISLINGLIIGVGIVLGILSADIWALTLFFFYGTHWLAGLAVSTVSLVTPQKINIKEDPTPRYAIYQRPAGGTVVFKGRQDSMEAWARSTWEFDRCWRNTCLHWFWTVTGTLSAICSVACMVNMLGYMQLAFLGLLLYASLAEIAATRITRILQGETKVLDRTHLVKNNEFRTTGVIRATVELQAKYRLSGLNWVELKRMPGDQIFQDMETLLKGLNQFQSKVEAGTEAVPDRGPRWHSQVDEAFTEFAKNRTEDPVLVARIQQEAADALEQWWVNREAEGTSVTEKVKPIV